MAAAHAGEGNAVTSARAGPGKPVLAAASGTCGHLAAITIMTTNPHAHGAQKPFGGAGARSVELMCAGGSAGHSTGHSPARSTAPQEGWGAMILAGAGTVLVAGLGTTAWRARRRRTGSDV
ncbi:hypothetical protein GCM10010411_85460 [Actinomadura fulvescens]|uniref:Uncharacterized protein n=2 Tax=Actinomadura fulvescens TaxID=46160 RepID=A0ABP6D6W6_9ACTN